MEAEIAVDISEKYNVSVVPTFIAFNSHNKVGLLEGANPSDLNKLIKSLSDSSSVQSADKIVKPEQIVERDINKRLMQLINTATVMLFMKGSPDKPRCGFSKQTVEILQKHSIKFASFDILTDEEVRQNLKVYSNWPTYPQLYVKGILLGIYATFA